MQNSLKNPRFRKYNDVLAYFYAQLPMYQRQGVQAYKKDLTNTLALLEACGNPHLGLKTIHIAGTNGKGSTSHIIAGALMSQGLKTGLYTSPHYRDFRERIKLNGELIPAWYVKKFANDTAEAMGSIKPSYFEMTVALAFSWFHFQRVDVAVIETGLGGRLDSTNVITPLVSVITNISYDHMNLLGNTLEEIANEKAGIIKPNIPVVVGERQPETNDVFRIKAQTENSEIQFAEDSIHIESDSEKYGTTLRISCDGKPWISNLFIDIQGPYQKSNLTTAFCALKVLENEFPLDIPKLKAHFKEFTKHTKFIGRWQWLQKKPDILADSAHNEGGLSLVLRAIQKMDYPKIHIVIGFVNDKEIDKVLELFPKDAVYYFCKANIPRGLDAETLCLKAKNAGLTGRNYTSVKRAYAAARAKAGKEELIFVGGSIFIVAEVI